MTGSGVVERLLERVPVPVAGLVLRDTNGDPTALLTHAECNRLVHWTDGSPWEPVRRSTDDDGHWALVRQLSPRYWVTAHVNQTWGDEEYLLFASFDDALAHYVPVVRGQQDASGGKAWRNTDVPGVLAGEELDLAARAGYSYADAARQYEADRAAALAAWSMLDALTDPI